MADPKKLVKRKDALKSYRPAVQNCSDQVDQVAGEKNKRNDLFSGRIKPFFQEVRCGQCPYFEVDRHEELGNNEHSHYGTHAPGHDSHIIQVYRFILPDELVGADIG